MKYDHEAYIAICLHISDQYIVYSHGVKDAHDLWMILATIFKVKGPNGIMNTCCKFFHTFIEEGANMEQHIRMHLQGHEISDQDFTSTLSTSLPSSWSTFITAITAGLPCSLQIMSLCISLNQIASGNLFKEQRWHSRCNITGTEAKKRLTMLQGKMQQLQQKGALKEDLLS